MFKYTLKRLFQSLVTVILIVSVVFLLLRLLPAEFHFSEDEWLSKQKEDLKYLKEIELKKLDLLFANSKNPEMKNAFKQDKWLSLQKIAVECENETDFLARIASMSKKDLLTKGQWSVVYKAAVDIKTNNGAMTEGERVALLLADSNISKMKDTYKQDQWLEIQKAAVESKTEDDFLKLLSSMSIMDFLPNADWSYVYNSAVAIKEDFREEEENTPLKEMISKRGLDDHAFVQLYRFYKNDLFKIAYEPHYFKKAYVSKENNQVLELRLGKEKYAGNVKADEVEIVAVFEDPEKDLFTKDEKKALSEEEKLARLTRYGYEEGKPLTQTIQAVSAAVSTEAGKADVVVLTLDGPVIEKIDYTIKVGSYTTVFKIRSYDREAEIAAANEKTDSSWENFIHTKINLSFGSPTRMKAMAIDSGDDVFKIIKSRMFNSFKIGIIALGIALLVGVPLGILQATFKDKALDYVGQTYTILINAVPSIVVYFLILIIGAKTFKLPFSYTEGDWVSMIMPIFCLSLGSSASYMLWMRRYMVDELNKDYIRLAKLKGMKTLTIMRKHVMKNAFLPLAQYLPYSVLLTVGGSLLVERVFSVDGLGKILTDSIAKCDTNMVLAIVSLYAVLGIVGLFFGDVLMILLDPRIRLTGKGGTR